MRLSSVIFIVILFSCSSTKIVPLTSTPHLVAGEGVLLQSIPGQSVVQGLRLFERAKRILGEDLTVKFLPEEEYTLLKNGLRLEELKSPNPADSSITKMAEVTKCRYVLKVSIVNTVEGAPYGNYTQRELDIYSEPEYLDGEHYEASLLIQVFDTAYRITKEEFLVTTSMNPLIINEEDGESRVNLSSVSAAISKAFEKGMKALRKGVVEVDSNE